jgi:hypothetical protein
MLTKLSKLIQISNMHFFNHFKTRCASVDQPSGSALGQARQADHQATRISVVGSASARGSLPLWADGHALAPAKQKP